MPGSTRAALPAPGGGSQPSGHLCPCPHTSEVKKLKCLTQKQLGKGIFLVCPVLVSGLQVQLAECKARGWGARPAAATQGPSLALAGGGIGRCSSTSEAAPSLASVGQLAWLCPSTPSLCEGAEPVFITELAPARQKKKKREPNPPHLSICSHARNIVQCSTKASLKIEAPGPGLPVAV